MKTRYSVKILKNNSKKVKTSANCPKKAEHSLKKKSQSTFITFRTHPKTLWMIIGMLIWSCYLISYIIERCFYLIVFSILMHQCKFTLVDGILFNYHQTLLLVKNLVTFEFVFDESIFGGSISSYLTDIFRKLDNI